MTKQLYKIFQMDFFLKNVTYSDKFALRKSYKRPMNDYDEISVAHKAEYVEFVSLKSKEPGGDYISRLNGFARGYPDQDSNYFVYYDKNRTLRYGGKSNIQDYLNKLISELRREL